MDHCKVIEDLREIVEEDSKKFLEEVEVSSEKTEISLPATTETRNRIRLRHNQICKRYIMKFNDKKMK
jgi:flagellar hook-basal body complex protein FliE